MENDIRMIFVSKWFSIPVEYFDVDTADDISLIQGRIQDMQKGGPRSKRGEGGWLM